MSYSNQPRIKSIDEPRGVLLKIAFWMLKRTLGKVITPAKVVYARYPSLLFVAKKLYDVQDKMKEISAEHKLLVQSLVATLNECDFCIDMSQRKALDSNYQFEKFNEIAAFEDLAIFSEPEKAALAYVTAVTLHVKVDDAVYGRLKKHWNDRAIIEITFTAAAENYLNRMTKPLGIGSDGLCMV